MIKTIHRAQPNTHVAFIEWHGLYIEFSGATLDALLRNAELAIKDQLDIDVTGLTVDYTDYQEYDHMNEVYRFYYMAGNFIDGNTVYENAHVANICFIEGDPQAITITVPVR